MEKIVHFSGVNVVVEEAQASTLHTLRVGDPVKVLEKGNSAYGGGKDICPGIIVSFEPFRSLPTLRVVYVKQTYGAAVLKFACINAETAKDFELIAGAADLSEGAELRREVEKVLGSSIAAKQRELDGLREQLAYFQSAFAQYWTPAEAAAPAAVPPPEPAADVDVDKEEPF